MRNVVAALMLVCLAGGARAQTPYNALTELNRLCVATKAQPKVVRTVALAAGYRTVPDDPAQLMIGSQAASVNIRIGSSRVPDEPELGDIQSDVCWLLTYPGASQAPQVLNWLGVNEKAPTPWTFFIIEQRSGPRIIGGTDVVAKRAAMQAGKLRLVKVERLSPEGLLVIYMAPHPAGGI